MNNNVNIFKKIILFYMFLCFGFFCFGFFEGLSSGSDDIVNDIDEPFSLLDIIVLVYFPILFYILFLLYKLKPLGKKIFLPFLILFEIFGYINWDLNDFIYDNKLIYYLDYFDYFLVGVIITFLYFTDVKKEFDL